MKRSILAAVGLAAALLVLANSGFGQEPNAAAEEPAIAGIWRADSASISPGVGNMRTLGDADHPCNATVSETQFTLRLGDQNLVDMAYVLDTKQSPWTIDLKSKDGVLLGICSRTGDALKISLNDESKGRPADFNAKTSGMVLALRQFHPSALCVINADGSGLKPILSKTDFTFLGSPDWSRNGRRIAFDGWKTLYGESFSQVHMFMCNADGSGFKELGEGAMPSWSPDDRQLTFCSNGPERGVCLMNADGSNRRCIDPEGWGSQWSPKRNEIAYSAHEDGTANLYVYDVAKEQRRALLDKSYQRIWWGITWSPDGDWICFKGALPDGNTEIAAVSVQGEKKGFKIILPGSAAPEVGNCNCTMAWGGSGSQILISMQKKTDPMKQLYLLDFKGERPPQLFPGYPTNWGNADTAWSPDFKKVVFAAKPPLKPAPPK